MRQLIGTAYLLLPLFGGALFHGLCLKYGWLGVLARPIDRGRTLGGRPLLGHSKTWRGPVAVAAGAAAVWALQQGPLHRCAILASIELADYGELPGAWFAALAGAMAELAELPNSFVKRRLGVEPSGIASGPLSVVFYLWDQLDLLVGFWLVCAAVIPVTAVRIASSVAIAAVVHPLVTLAGYLLRMRPTAR